MIVVDVSDSKLATARQLGATETVDASQVDNVVEAVRELSGGGVDYSFEAIGKKATAEQAFKMLDVGGTATVIGMVPDDQRLEIKAMDLLSEKRLQGSMMGSNQFRVDIPRLISMYLDGRSCPSGAVGSHRMTTGNSSPFAACTVMRRRAGRPLGDQLRRPARRAAGLGQRRLVAVGRSTTRWCGTAASSRACRAHRPCTPPACATGTRGGL